MTDHRANFMIGALFNEDLEPERQYDPGIAFCE
jgi:hypothetical protein